MPPRLERTSSLQKLLDLLAVLALGDNGLEVRVTADVLLVDEDVGHGALAGDLEERVLHLAAVLLLVQLVVRVLCAIAVEDALGVVAVRAVGLAEDDCGETDVSAPCPRIDSDEPMGEETRRGAAGGEGKGQAEVLG